MSHKDHRPFNLYRCVATSLWAALLAAGCGGPAASEAPRRPSASPSASLQPSASTSAPPAPLACPDGRATAEQAREALRLGEWSEEGGLSIPREAFMRGIRGCIDEDAVLGWLRDPDAKERHIAAEILRKAGTRYVREAPLAAQVVEAWSSDPAQGNRRVLAWAVQRIDLEGTGTAPAVRARLESAESYFDRGYLILGLMQEHPSSDAAFRLVYERLQDKDGVVRAWAMEGLGDSQVHHEKICAAAVGWVAQADGGNRVQAAIKTFYRLDGCVDHFGALLDAVATHVRAKGPATTSVMPSAAFAPIRRPKRGYARAPRRWRSSWRGCRRSSTTKPPPRGPLRGRVGVGPETGHVERPRALEAMRGKPKRAR